MEMKVTPGSTDVTTYVVLRSTSDNEGEAGLTVTDFDLTYVRTLEEPAAKVDASALADQDSAHADNSVIEIDGTNMPGLYRVDWPDAAFAAGVREVILCVKCAGVYTEFIRVSLETLQTGDAYARLGAPVGASISADIAVVDANVDSVLADTGTDGVIVASLAANSIDATVLANNAITAAKIATGAIDADALAADAVTEIWNTELAESYATDGANGTAKDLLYMLLAIVGEFSISGTTITCKKLDGSTTAMTFTLDDATNPTSRTKSS